MTELRAQPDALPVIQVMLLCSLVFLYLPRKEKHHRSLTIQKHYDELLLLAKVTGDKGKSKDLVCQEATYHLDSGSR